jgi:hypothetical protein
MVLPMAFPSAGIEKGCADRSLFVVEALVHGLSGSPIGSL